jgi:ribonuclease HI
MFNQKFYVVWRGRKEGLYTNWTECKAQVHQYPNAMFKSFQTLQEAQLALNKNSLAYYNHPYRKREEDIIPDISEVPQLKPKPVT